ncbi:unnamed protein product [Clavelina lepadiformis]|uniref:RNase H type-1 domain-containing protein n=1 Tax=Clavelina lepadiformis TaxID=159417 RepID=A0ABP0F1N9_CLALP
MGADGSIVQNAPIVICLEHLNHGGCLNNQLCEKERVDLSQVMAAVFAIQSARLEWIALSDEISWVNGGQN